MAKGKYEDWLTKDNLIRIEGWARDGATEEQIAKNMGIASSTLRVWKDKYEAISAAIKNGKQPVDYRVENAMLKSALGFTVKVKKAVKLRTEAFDEKGRRVVSERVEIVDEDVYIPPNTTAQIFWLKNRKPKQWRDKQIVETDNSALERLDEILKQTRNNAKAAESKLEYITEDDIIQQEAE